jgi:ribosomal-protein-alanine N-acetyltransferase
MPQIKEFTPKDVAKIAAIERICFADAWSLDMIKTESSQQKFCALVIEEQDETLGFIMGSVLFEDAEIYKVAILPQHRGKGLGSMAVNAFADKVKERGGERIFLEVRPSNTAALRLYQNRGFEKNRLRKRYYADGEDCLEMKKELYPDEE